MKRAVPLLLLVVLAAGGIRFYSSWFGKKSVGNELKLSGNIEAHESLVSFKVTGRIAALPIEEGQRIKSGEVLAQLDNEDYNQQVAVDDATARVRHSQLELV